ncbi:serpin family protein [Candidatus Bipolaricaulota bacterium]|nr:serpin family protein [Candidatus Bipolaricaulota bacterium]
MIFSTKRYVLAGALLIILLGFASIVGTAPAVNEASLKELVAGNNAFAFDLYQALRTNECNLFFSPYSISLALAITYAGARDNTAIEMAETLHFTLQQDRLHLALNALGEELLGRDENINLTIANALWGQAGYPFLPDFLAVLDTGYDAGLRRADFIFAPEGARRDINAWVNDATEGKIKDLMGPGTITPDTRLVLANAIYFKGTWKVQFDARKTEFAPFYRLDGSQVKVSMMRMKEHFPYTEGMNFQAIELPYTGDALSMVILLPRAGMFADFEANLSVERLDAILAQLCSEKVQLAMPRFELTSEFSLADTLANLGMPNAFKQGIADFSGMDGTRDLFIGCVAHKTYVSVNEEGTEAAAATGVSMTLSLPAAMTIDHPFIFLIRDIETGTILFVGRVVEPTGS